MIEKLTTNEQQLAKQYNDSLQQLAERKKQITAAMAQVEDQIKLIQGALWGLNMLAEMNRAAAVPPPPAMVMSGDEEVEGNAEETETTPQS